MPDQEYSIAVRLEGRLFTADTNAIIRASAHRIVQKAVERGEERLAQTLRKQPEGVYLQDGKSTGNYRRNVTGGTIWYGSSSALLTDQGVVYGPWLEGTSSRNDSTRFKGYATFRKTRDWMQNTLVPKLLTEEMTLLSRDLS